MHEPADRPQDVVERGYDRVADAYAALERPGAEWPRLRRLQGLLARLPAGADVLDIGCGNGIPTMRAICERHSGVGVDISGEQIRRARANVPGGTFVQADIASLDFPESSFDAIVAFYTIEHVPRDRHADLFRRFRSWLRPGGYLLFTLEPYDEPGRTGEWLGVPMFISSFDPETTVGVLAQAGFEVLSRDVESQLEGDREIEYLWVVARRRD
jgi:cyclopropane fatty-acyl-phospholipid synthase-like methyltransferase